LNVEGIMTQVDARLNRGQLQALLAALDCFTSVRHTAGEPTLWWKGKTYPRETFSRLAARFEEELKLLGE
jgi:hypothetical protein